MITIVIILYKSEKYIYDCLDSIKKNNLSNLILEIILIDNYNGSTYHFDDDKVIYKKNTKNIGFSKSLNYAVDISKGKYILSLNPDTLLYDNTIKIMYESFNIANNIGAVGVKVLNMDGTYLEYFPIKVLYNPLPQKIYIFGYALA